MAETEDDPLAAEGSPPEGETTPSAAEEKRHKHALEVVAAVGKPATRLAGEHDRWLAEIRKAPQERWTALVDEVLDHSLSIKHLRERVAELKAEAKSEPEAEET